VLESGLEVNPVSTRNVARPCNKIASNVEPLSTTLATRIVSCLRIIEAEVGMRTRMQARLAASEAERTRNGIDNGARGRGTGFAGRGARISVPGDPALRPHVVHCSRAKEGQYKL